jgi:secreted Zn-dependent insulinase-like peptidase
LINRFLIGNLESLKVDGVHEALQKYYEDNYSSNRMNLAMVGPHGLEELELYAEQNFA